MRKSRPCFNKKGSIARTLPFICALLAYLTTDFRAVFNPKMKHKQLLTLKQTDASMSNWYCKDKYYFSNCKTFTR
jgi:hypothetical protein